MRSLKYCNFKNVGIYFFLKIFFFILLFSYTKNEFHCDIFINIILLCLFLPSPPPLYAPTLHPFSLLTGLLPPSISPSNAMSQQIDRQQISHMREDKQHFIFLPPNSKWSRSFELSTVIKIDTQDPHIFLFPPGDGVSYHHCSSVSMFTRRR